jgi:hypothetical protein
MTILKCKNKIWIENISDLFCDYKIIPLGCQTLEAKMNAVTRFIFFIFLLLLIAFDLKKSLIFLSFSLLFIIIIYYILKNKKMNQYENFTYTQMTPQNTPSMFAQGPNGYVANNRANISTNPVNNTKNILIDRPSTYRFCNDEVTFDFNDEDYMSPNQKLVGQANPKTLIPPVIVPPSHDLSYWKANNLITHSHVNDMKQIDDYQSGYQVTTCCGNTEGDYIVPREINKRDKLVRYNYLKADSEVPTPLYKQNNYEKNKLFTRRSDIKENFTPLNSTGNGVSSIPPVYEIKPNQSGHVNISCGYNPIQLFEAGLPTNYPAGNCEKDPAFKKYNENLFMQTIQPGVYTTTQIDEPINSNIGISFTQQFEPLTCKTNNRGDVIYTEHDPRIFNEDVIEPLEETVNESNVYDPRFSGYGTSYRSYTDDNLGQTRFYYDDVNAIRMPNYITRSKVDFLPYADTYGPMINEDGNEYNSIISGLVDDSWTRNNIDFRTGLQQSLMRKVNAQKWQQRQFPISTSGQRMLGGKGC